MTQSLGNADAATAALRVTGAGAPLHVEEIGKLQILHSTDVNPVSFDNWGCGWTRLQWLFWENLSV